MCGSQLKPKAESQLIATIFFAILFALALMSDDMDLPGLFMHQLKGDRKDIWSVRVNGNWRITYRFTGRDVEIVNYEDYH